MFHQVVCSSHITSSKIGIAFGRSFFFYESKLFRNFPYGKCFSILSKNIISIFYRAISKQKIQRREFSALDFYFIYFFSTKVQLKLLNRNYSVKACNTVKQLCVRGFSRHLQGKYCARIISGIVTLCDFYISDMA